MSIGTILSRRTFGLWACLFGALLGLAACETQPPMTTKTLQQPSQVTQTIRMGEYRVAPGDKIRVVVLSDTELSGDYEVDSTGLISPRMAGRMSVVGMTTVEIESSCTAESRRISRSTSLASARRNRAAKPCVATT